MEPNAVTAAGLSGRSIVVSDVIDVVPRMNSLFTTTFVICLISLLWEGFDLNVFGLAMPVLMKDMKLTPAQAGLLGSYGIAGMVFGALLFGMLADIIGRKHALMIGTFTYALFTGAVAFTHSVAAFGVCRFIAGLGFAGVLPILLAIVSEYSPKKKRATLILWLTSSGASGTVIGALVSFGVLPRYGWRPIFLFTFLGLLVIPFQFAKLPESMSYLVKHGRKDDIAKTLKSANPDFVPAANDTYELTGFNKGKASVASLFQGGFAKNTILFCIILWVNYCFIYGFTTWLPKLMTLRGWSLNFGLWFALIYNMGFILGIPSFGWAADKYGCKRVLITGLVLTGCLLCLVSQLHAAILLSIFLFLSGACQHGQQGAVSAYLSQSYPLSFRGTGLGLAQAVGRFGGTLGPIMTGILLSYRVSVPANVVVFGILPFVSAFFVLLTTDFTRTKQSHEVAVPLAVTVNPASE